MRSTLFVILLAIGVGGCGDHGLPNDGEDMAAGGGSDMSIGDMGPNPDARVFVTFGMFAMDYATAVCNHYVTCKQLDSAQMNACIERNLRHSGWDQDVEIMKGRMQINELQCLDAINNARCDNSDTVAWGSKCVQFLYIAHQDNGAPCLSSDECTSGFCQHGGSDAGHPEQVTGCPGTCATPKSSGAPCRINSDCASDSACEGAPGSQVCTKLAALNEACQNPFSPVADFTKQPCQFGLSCPTFPGATPATCIVPSTQTALHGACDPFQGGVSPAPACDSGMYCQLQYTAGAACTGAAGDCASPLGAYCDTTAGMCQVPSGGKCETKLASGATCDPHNEGFYSFVDSQCADGTICYQVGAQALPTCQAYGGGGADCKAIAGGGNSTCKVGFACDATSHKCVAWSKDGDSCTGNTQCPSSLPAQNVCIADNADAGTAMTCQAAKNFGATCAPGFEETLCAPADNAGTSHCAPSGSSGTCAPNCF